jgi:hypothetical protein
MKKEKEIKQEKKRNWNNQRSSLRSTYETKKHLRVISRGLAASWAVLARNIRCSCPPTASAGETMAREFIGGFGPEEFRGFTPNVKKKKYNYRKLVQTNLILTKFIEKILAFISLNKFIMKIYCITNLMILALFHKC